MIKVKVDDKDVELEVIVPTRKEDMEAMKSYYSAYNEALAIGAPLRLQIIDTLKLRGLWSDTKQAAVEEMQRDILDKEYALDAGGIKATEGREVALDLSDLRNKLADLLSVHASLDNITVEAKSDNAKFNHLVVLCTKYKETGKQYFANLEDYQSKADTSTAILASRELYSLLYDSNADFMDSLPENKFLRDFKFVNDDGQLINKDGELVSRRGETIDEDGYLLNEEGERVTTTGKKLDDQGEFMVERKPFLDDDNNPIIDEPKVKTLKVRTPKAKAKASK